MGIREPRQERSIETKRKIVEAGYKLFATKSFYKTNTAQIAKEAGVSTGIVYGYFNNKKDILVEVIKIYVEKTYDPVFELIDKINNNSLEKIILDVLNLAEKLHVENYDIHKELNAVAQTDDDINKVFIDMQDIITDKFVKKLNDVGYKSANCEGVHIAMNLIQSYVHEVIYDKHNYLDYEKFKKEVIRLIGSLFK